jgi:3-phenylpropionate/trans-cinnamate dioxygenase ferredoxin subunit
MSDPQFTPVCSEEDLPANGARPVRIGGLSILVVRHDGTLFAIENECSHAAQSLECGRIRNGWIMCPAHGARFDLATGEPLGPPAPGPIRTFPVRVHQGQVEIDASGIA